MGTADKQELQSEGEKRTAFPKENNPPAAAKARPAVAEEPPQFRADLRQAQDALARYRKGADPVDLDEAAACWERILEHPSWGDSPSSFRCAVLNDAGGSLLQRYRARGNIADLDRALALWRNIAQGMLPDPALRPKYLSNLGNALSDRYALTGQMADLDDAIGCWQEAVSLTTAGWSDRASILNNLGTGFYNHYCRTGNHQDLESAIAAWQEAVHATPAESPERPGLLNNLGAGLRDRYYCDGHPDDLEAALHLWEEATETIPRGSPDRPLLLNNLGNGLRARYLHSGQPQDLEAALHAWQEALCDIPRGALERLAILNDLGNGLLDRYYRGGALADLEAAIDAWQEAAQAAPADSPDRPQLLKNLAHGLRTRYAQCGRLEDLEEAIHIAQDAVQATPSTAPERPAQLNNMGNALRDYYARRGRAPDLEEAIRAYQGAVAGSSPTAPDRLTYLNNLGNALLDRYNRMRHEQDLDIAIRSWQEAIQQSNPDSLARAGWLNNLGNGWNARYDRTGQGEDLEAALEAWREAVNLTPTDASMRPAYLNNLGNGLRDRHDRTGQPEDREAATRCYREACLGGRDRYPEAALTAAQAWGDWALGRRAWPEASEAYRHGLAAIERLFRTQLLRQNKEAWLRAIQGLAAHAAYALARAGCREEGLVTLELGRARLLSEVLDRDRAEIESLDRDHPDLAERYRQAAARLVYLESAELYPETPPPGLDLTGQVRAARAALDKVIARIRQLPDYAHFMAAPEPADIAAAARPAAPLVYLAVTAIGGMALVVPDGEIEAVWLDDLTEETLHKQAQGYLDAYADWRSNPESAAAQAAWFAALEQMTHWLGNTIGRPLLETLRRLGARQTVLIPQGLLGLLPLHAAWTDDPTALTGRLYALDEMAFSYAPNARALQSAQEVAARVVPDRLLGVDEPQPVRASPLPSAAWEIAAAADHFSPQNRRVLKGPEATASRLRELLLTYPVLHLSCHGQADLREPLQSGLRLAHDETLTLRDILSLRLPNTRLAVLSACETGIPGAELPDEVVSLPAGLVQAGAAGVVGTLWAVADVSTAMLMVRFYDLWRKEGIEPTAALRQAQIWLRDTTNAEKAAYFQRDIPRPGVIRMPAAVAAEFYSQTAVRDPEARDFAHPFYWAAFYLTGV